MNSPGETFKEALVDLERFLLAVQPYADQVVLCGGWVPFCYRKLPELRSPHYAPLFSYDFDLAVPPNLAMSGPDNLRDCLTAGGFVPVPLREPPVAFYQHERWGMDQRAPVYGELLTALTGSAADARGQPKEVREIQPGVRALQLRYLDLLFHEPLTLQARQVFGSSCPKDFTFRVPNPAAYVLQKGLVLKRRKPEKRGKDLAYVSEVAVLWYDEVNRVRKWAGSIRARTHEWKMWVERSYAALQRAFDSPASEGPVSAEKLFQGSAHGVSARAVYTTTAAFLQAVLGTDA